MILLWFNKMIWVIHGKYSYFHFDLFQKIIVKVHNTRISFTVGCYIVTFEWVSEWLLFNANSAIFQLYYGENKLIFNEIMMRSALF